MKFNFYLIPIVNVNLREQGRWRLLSENFQLSGKVLRDIEMNRELDIIQSLSRI